MIYAGVALLIAVTAYFMQPKPVGVPPVGSVAGEKKLFPEFDDPLKAKSLEIVRYDAALGTLNDFKVAETDGNWRVVSYSNYPADASTSIRDAAMALIDLEVIDVATDLPGEHELFGVIAPNKEKLKGGEEGVGLSVKVEGEGGKDLVNLIVGKEVADKDGHTFENQRFVRKPGQDRVFVVRLDLSALSTDFEDWIETDLLKLSPAGISKLQIKDYAVAMARLSDGSVRPTVSHRSEMLVRQEQDEWSLESLKIADQKGWQPAVLALDEELDTAKLNEMKKALGNLRIVGVNRKPKSLAAQLKSDEPSLDEEAQAALEGVGFRVAFDPAGKKIGLYSDSGDLVVGMADGHQYNIRFGSLTTGQGGDSATLNRNVFVTVEPTPGFLKPPELAAMPVVPEVKPGDAASQAKAAEVEAERKSIENANQTLKDAHQKKVNTVMNRVRELNARFADWFFVISEDVYKKVHLSRESLVKETSGAVDKGFNIDAFRKLENDGLSKTPPASPAPGRPVRGLPPGFPGAPR